MPKKFIFSILVMGAFSGCAHSFYYSPEVAGKGATESRSRSVDFAIPPSTEPELKFRIRSLGTEKVKDQNMFVVRMAFARPKNLSAKKANAREYMVPAEQTIQLGLGNKSQIKPAFIRTKARKDNVIELTGVQSEAIDLLYPLPKGNSGTKDIERILFHWSLHYGNNKKEAQVTRFDRYDGIQSYNNAEQFPGDSDYPYDIAPLWMPGWEVNPDPFWWPMIW
jgi:hypothetical protein